VKTGDCFADLVEEASQHVDLQLKTVDGVMAASDHIGFYRKDIPCFHFFSGFTSTYHTPDDDVEALNLEGIVKTVDLAELMIDSIARLPERPQFNQVQTARRRGSTRGMAYLGITPDYSAEAEQLRVTSVADGSPAEKGGMKAGDILLKMEDVEIKDMQTLTDQLRKHRPDTEVKIIVKRGEEEVTLTVTLGRVS
jgi:S1-C subfamily serine protease